MKVKYVNIYNEHAKKYEDTSDWLTIGKEYVVLEVEISPGRDVWYRTIGDAPDGGPGLYDSKQFVVTSGKVSSNWSVSQIETGLLTLGPKSWQAEGFWEGCYDRDEKMLDIYKYEAAIILEEENEYWD